MLSNLKDFDLVQRVDVIKDLARGKKVLHLGCTNHPYTEQAIRDGSLLHNTLASIADDLYGIDSDADGIDKLLRAGAEKIFPADLENLDALDLDQSFDVIVAGEVIEHLNNPGSFLQGIRRFMHEDSILILTTINAYCAMRSVWYGLRGRKGRIEFVHPDHVAYYSYSTLKTLIDRHNMHLERFLFYDIGREHRPHNRWFLNVFNDVCVRLAPQWADGLVAVCRIKK